MTFQLARSETKGVTNEFKGIFQADAKELVEIGKG